MDKFKICGPMIITDIAPFLRTKPRVVDIYTPLSMLHYKSGLKRAPYKKDNIAEHQ